MLIEGQRYRSLVDSGAEVSLMHERVYNNMKHKPKLQNKSIHLQSANGTLLGVIGCINIPLRIGGTEVSQNFYVVKNLNRNVLLGLDFMEDNNVRLYFDLKSMRINGKYYVNLEPDIHISSTVRMRSKIKLKPRSAKLCYGKVRNSPELPSCRSYEVTEIEKGFLVNEPGLQIVNSVSYLDKNRKIPILVVNNTDKFQTIYRHGLVAKIDAVSENNLKSVGSVLNEPVCPKNINLDDLQMKQEHKYRSDIEKVILENQDLFASKDSDLGHTDTVKMKIDTGNNPPIRLRPYRTPLQNTETIDNAIDEMLDAGVISRSRSPWSFPVVIVNKKDGSKRFCVDYRKLNNITVKNSFPLPLIDDLLSRLGKAKYFSSLDLKSGYWQVLMDDKDKEKTAFVTSHKGLFQFNVMPFGLSNAPAVFQELMSIVLEGLSDFALAYLDDILIFSRTIEDHLRQINVIFDRLRTHGLKLKLKKCSFLQEETNYLGFVVNESGIKADQEKVESIKSIPPPTCIREVRSFIGMCSYYRRFIPNFSAIAEPIIHLTKKHAHFKWTREHQKAFDFLKNSLTVVPLLVYPDPNKKYTLYTDASNTCIGACLTQECDVDDPDVKSGPFKTPIEKPIYYLSHKLNRTQCRYSVIEKEAYAIYYSLQKLDYYLHNAEFTIKTDHKPLKYLLEAPMTNKRIQMWALSIAGYNCKIEYIPGSQNTCADLLSRHPLNVETNKRVNSGLSDTEECIQTDINDNCYQVNIIDSTNFDPKQYASCKLPFDDELQKPEKVLSGFNLIEEQAKDEEIVILRTILLHGQPTKDICRKYMVVDNVLYFLSDPDGDVKLRLYVPSHLRAMLIRQYHDDNGHMGVQKCYDSLRIKYFWPNQFKELHKYVTTCVVCQTRSLQKVRQPLQETDQVNYPFQKVSLDLSGPYETTLSGNKYIVAFCDWFSGWPEAFSVPNKEANTIAHLLLEEIFPRFGCCLQLVSDNGSENVNKVMKEVMERLNIDHVRTSVYHPQSNAKVERFHRTLHDILAKKVSQNPQTWDLHLNQALAAIRFNVSESSKYSPFYLLYNRDPVLPVDNLFKLRRKYQGESWHEIALQEQHKTFTQVRRSMKRAKQKQARYHDKNTKDISFEIGDPVYYKNNNRKGKLDLKWKPYYRILDKTGPVSYVIKNQLDGSTARVHAELLRLANIDWDDIKPQENETRPLRKTQYVVPPEKESDSETTIDSDDDTPLQNLIDKYRKERENSDSEDDIPLMELAKRLKSRDQSDSDEGQGQESEPDVVSDQESIQPIHSDTENLDDMEIDQVTMDNSPKSDGSLFTRFVQYVAEKLD